MYVFWGLVVLAPLHGLVCHFDWEHDDQPNGFGTSECATIPHVAQLTEPETMQQAIRNTSVLGNLHQFTHLNLSDINGV